jgi:8-oxo-dGTP pyrophosphatase MutT (NUDIX family)
MLSGVGDAETSDEWSWRYVSARLDALATRQHRPLEPVDLPPGFRRAAVLALVGELGGRATLVCTRRATSLRAHSGEICLPGGRIEPGESPEGAAIREACEEVTFDRRAIEVVGRLDETWSGAANHVMPVVARYHGDLAGLRANSSEVDEVLVADLGEAARAERQTVNPVRHQGYVYIDDVIDAGDFEIYGMTADVVLDLLAFLAGRDRQRVPARAQGLRHFMLHAPPGWGDG